MVETLIFLMLFRGYRDLVATGMCCGLAIGPTGIEGHRQLDE
jgi:hypothetical protein